MKLPTTRALALQKSLLPEKESDGRQGGKKFNYRLLAACGICAAVAAVFGFFLFDKSMSAAEGWYSYYAYLINEEGAVPYVDFPLLFPPLYVYCIALFTKIFGYGILALRVLGVFIYIALCVLGCLIFYKLFRNEFIAAAMGILVFAFLQSEIAQVSYDYIRFMDVCVFASIYFFLCYLEKAYARGGEERTASLSPRSHRAVIASSLFAVLASLFKQSSGLIFFFFIAAALVILLILEKNRRQAAYSLLWYVAVAAAVYLLLFALMAIQGSLGAYLHYNFGSSVGAKGGVFTILFGNFARIVAQNFWKTFPFALLFVVLIGAEVYLSASARRDKQDGGRRRMLLLGVFAAALVVVLVCCFLIPAFGKWAADSYIGSFTKWVFLTNMLLFIACLAIVLQRKIVHAEGEGTLFFYNYLFVSGAAFALSYAVTTSGSLGQSQVALCVGVTLGSAAYFARFAKKEIACSLLAFLFVFLGATFFARKIETVYSWWNMTVGDYWEQTEEITDIAYLNGIKVSPEYYEMYHNVVNAVEEYTDANDPIFVFPHAPIFYLLTDRHSDTYTKVQWFDVASDEEIVADIDVLREDPPKAIVFFHIPEDTIESHEKTFRGGEACGLRLMQEFLVEFVQTDYTEVSSDDIGGGYIVTVHVRT